MAGIIVYGSRPEDFLRFTPHPESASSFEVTGCLQGRSVTEPCLTLLHTEAFLAGLAEFERTRQGMASLNGTYDFRLNVRPHGPTGAAWLSFYLAEYLWLEDNSHGRHALEGGLVVPGELVGQLLRDFQQLLVPCRT